MAEIQLNRMKLSIAGGSYSKAFGYTSGIRKIMEEYRSGIEQMMARREQLGEQLMQDEYAEPDLSCHTEDELIVDYEAIVTVIGDCDRAMEYVNGIAAAIFLEDGESIKESEQK